MIIYDFNEIKWLQLYPERDIRILIKFAYVKTTENDAWFEFKDWNGRMSTIQSFPKVVAVERALNSNYTNGTLRALTTIRHIALNGLEEKYLYPIQVQEHDPDPSGRTITFVDDIVYQPTSQSTRIADIARSGQTFNADWDG